MMFSNNQLIGIGLVGLGAVVYLSRKASEVATDVGQSVNPVNQDNIFYSGISAVGEKLTGDEHWTLGGQLHEWFN